MDMPPYSKQKNMAAKKTPSDSEMTSILAAVSEYDRTHDVDLTGLADLAHLMDLCVDSKTGLFKISITIITITIPTIILPTPIQETLSGISSTSSWLCASSAT